MIDYVLPAAKKAQKKIEDTDWTPRISVQDAPLDKGQGELERRRAPRKPFLARAVLTVYFPISESREHVEKAIRSKLILKGVCRNLSMGGATIELEKRSRSLNGLVNRSVRLELIRSAENIKGSGTIRWGKDSNLLGVELSDLSGRSWEVLYEWCSELETREFGDLWEGLNNAARQSCQAAHESALESRRLHVFERTSFNDSRFTDCRTRDKLESESVSSQLQEDE